VRLDDALAIDDIAVRPLNFRDVPTRRPDPRQDKVILTRNGRDFMAAWADTLNYIKPWANMSPDVRGREDWQPLKYSRQWLGMYPTFRVVIRLRSSEDL